MTSDSHTSQLEEAKALLIDAADVLVAYLSAFGGCSHFEGICSCEEHDLLVRIRTFVKDAEHVSENAGIHAHATE